MDQRERFEAWFVRYRHNRPSAGYGDLYAAWQAAESDLLERAITTIQSDSDAASELGHERFSRYCAEVVAKLRWLAGDE
jgi:hypothetical protein